MKQNERSFYMCHSEETETTEIRETIDGCEVILKFSDSPNVKSENAIIDILMTAFEERVNPNLGY